jgi:putative FmdB family regulatory protein
MPVYNYECPRCGDFEAIRPVALFDQPADCPDCGTAAPRLLSAPISRFAAEDVSAGPRRAGHGGACGCCGPRAGRTRKAAAPEAPAMPSFLSRG